MKEKRSYQKVTANWKRIMSRLLVIAMVMTSLPMTQVQAAGLSTGSQVESTVESSADDESQVSVESTEPESNESVESDSADNTETNPTEYAEPDLADEEETTPEESTEPDVAEGEETTPVESTETIQDDSEESVETEEVESTEAESTDVTTPDIVVDGATVTSPEVNNYEVTFRYAGNSGDAVYLAGTMNGWSTTANQLTNDGSNVYSCTVTLSSGVYEYKFVVNGGWYNDPSNSNYVDGGDNNVVRVGSPIINGNEVTFYYLSDTATTVNLAGTMNGWSTTANSLTKGEDNLFSYTTTLALGKYTYKYVVDSGWINDPWNSSYEGTDNNNVFVVSGMEDTSAQGLKGNEIELPSTLKYVDTTGAESLQSVTYSAKNTEEAAYVTINGNKVTVDAAFEGTTLELIATAANGVTSTAILTLSDKQYTYTIYARSAVEEKMSVDTAALWIEDAAGETAADAAEYAFTELVELEDGNTWLKTEVNLIFAEKLGLTFKEKGTESGWSGTELFYANTAGTDKTLYIIDGDIKVYTSLDELPAQGECCVVVEYTRADGDYTNTNAYSWNTGYGTFSYAFMLQNGKYVAKIPVTPSDSDKTIGFIARKNYDWNDKDGGDNLVTIPADQNVVKVRFADGAITEILPYNCGSAVNRSNNKITFYYRDDSLFADGNLASLDGKVQLVVKTSTSNAEVDGTHTMSYDANAERFYFDVALTGNTDYYYYYLIDGKKVLDAYNSKTATVDDTEYSLLRNRTYNVELSASIKNAIMDYNDNNLLTVSWSGKDGENLEDFKAEKIYADLSPLGLDSETLVDTELLKLTFGCEQDIPVGEKTITVTLVDDSENTYTTTVKVTITERIKTANTEEKLGDFDWDEAVIYFAVTDRFFDGNSSNNTATSGYDASDATDEGRYHGGDFAGLTQKIDYLYELGVNTIWITPIVDNIDEDVYSEDVYSEDVEDAEYYAYHGYWAEDFTKLNPHLGTEAEFKAMVDAAHAKGMKIMVDVVLNHAGYDTTDYFNSILKVDDTTVNMIRGAEDTISGDEKKDSLSGLPDFLTEDEEVRNQLIEWQTTWMKEYGIDYYRVDTVKHVDNTTWSAFKNALTEIDQEFKLIGEYYGASYENDYDQLNTGRMDSLLDFGFKYYAKDFASGAISSAEANLAARDKTIGNTAMLGSFLSSHDEDGLLYTFKSTDTTDGNWWAEAQMKVAATFQITSKGQPVIYYGEEIGLTGANNYPLYDNRYDFEWSKVTEQEKVDNSFYNHYKTLLNIRRDYSEVFAKGSRTVIAGSDAKGYEVISRSYEGTNIYVGMNVWGTDVEATFYVSGAAGSTYTDLYNNKTYKVAADGSLTVTIPNATKGGTAILVQTDGTDAEIVDTNTVTVKLHYEREDKDYTDWNVWFWLKGKGGQQYDFAEENGEMVATITVEGRAVSKVYYYVRKGDWKEKDVDKEQEIDISDIVSGTVHFYVKAGVEGGTRVLGADAIIGSKILSASYERATNKVTIETSLPVSGSLMSAFEIKCTDGTTIGVSSVKEEGSTYTLTLEKDLSSMDEMLKNYLVHYDGYDYLLSTPNVYSSEEFENAYTYSGNDLGAVWTKESTTFKVWAPTADSVKVALYKSGTAGTEDLIKTIDMTQGEQGVWSATETGDLNGTYYTYLVEVNGKTNEACDPYAKTTGVNGLRAMVLDMDSTDPEGWDEDVSPNSGMSYTDAVIYELHVRDASIDDSSGVSEEHQGKFLGLTENGTTTEKGTATVLDHMVELGITHVHLLPIYDYASVDETKLDEEQFNWGYDPLNYNTPEGSYSTDPYNGEVRVNEMKQMVKALHDNNINVIMDVVYNHVYDADSFCFNQIVPQYFSRTYDDGSYSNGSGCGNDTASERAMVQKYIVDSVLYWKEEYHIDGFRFDLVGLLDTETMNAVIDTVHAKYPDVIFYGEGWTLGTEVSKDGYSMATQTNAAKTPGLAYFNDTMRNILAGENGKTTGFVSGLQDQEGTLSECVTADTWWIPQPTQTVNYVSCHDNYTLMDKLNVTRADASEADRIKMNNLAAAIYMTSQGIPFIHAGEEFLRTKTDENGKTVENSYNSSDYVNKLRWYNLDDEKYADVSDYYKGLIEFRKNHKALRLTTSDEVAANVSYHWVTDEVMLFNIKGKDSVEGEVSDGIIVIYNANTTEKTFSLYNGYGIEEGEWKVYIDGENAGIEVLDTITDGQVTVAPISAMVLVKGEAEDKDSVYDENFKERVILSQTKLKLKVGESTVLTAKVNVEGATVTWSTSDETVATVNAEGKITAAAVGTATITATTASGKTASCTVYVYDDNFTMTIEPATLELAVGDTQNLTVVYNPANVPLEAEWNSSDEKVAKVDSKGKVTAVAAGTATITATVGEKSATCIVTVIGKLDEGELEIPTVTAVTNLHTNLSDVTLPEGWEWVYGDIPLKAFAGMQMKKFQAVYSKEGYESVTKEVPVNIITVTKVNVTADASIIESGKTTGLQAEIVTTGGYVPKDMLTVEWDSLKADIATVTKDGSDELAATLTGVKAGRAQIKANVTISDGKVSKTLVSAKKSIKVSATAFAQISFKNIEKFTKKDNSNVYVYPFTESTKAVVTIESTASKLKLKSSDSKVVSVGKVTKNAEGNFTAELTVKKAGYVELTATANDAVKTTAAVELYVKDAVPNVSTDKVELNNKAVKTATVSVYPNEDYAIESVSIDSTVFAISRVGNTDDYAVSMAAGTAKGTYKQTLTIKVKDAGEYQVPLTISVISKEPSVKVKQAEKVNLFYTDKEANGSLIITASEEISNVVLKDCDFEYNNETKEISVKENADRTNPDKKGVVSITLKDYAEPIEKNITIATENKAPKFTLSAKSASLYPTVGIEEAQVSITDTTNGVSITAEDIQVTFRQVKDKEVTAYAVAKKDNSVSFTRTDSTFTSKATADIAVQKANFSQPVTLTYAISVSTKTPSLVLSKKAVILNKNETVKSYEADTTIVSIKAAPNAGLKEVSVEAANVKAEKQLGTSIVFEASADGAVTAKLKDTANLAKGTYKFNVIVKITESCTLKTALSVKVVDVAPEKTVTLKKSGSIDVLNRDTTAIVYTPKLKNITGEITDVKLTGRAAHLFKAELENGRIKVTVKGDNKEEQNQVNLVTKYNYRVNIQLTVSNGESTCTIVTNEVKFKLNQSKPKMAALPKNAVIFNMAEGSTVPLTISATNKDGTEVAVKEVELTNFTNAFAYEDGELKLVNRGKVVRGKTYSLKLKVYYEGCADSEKPATVTYKVKVK